VRFSGSWAACVTGRPPGGVAKGSQASLDTTVAAAQSCAMTSGGMIDIGGHARIKVPFR